MKRHRVVFFSSFFSVFFKAGVLNIRPVGQNWPARVFNLAILMNFENNPQTLFWENDISCVVICMKTKGKKCDSWLFIVN